MGSIDVAGDPMEFYWFAALGDHEAERCSIGRQQGSREIMGRFRATGGAVDAGSLRKRYAKRGDGRRAAGGGRRARPTKWELAAGSSEV
ncbi:hypothetical protein EVAR_88597_1 [Eumeta japonica]|uniref:Uncharacterized protein n=1 Tax=Eumeta variegata TaxID=151549 RepID=A0A4C2A1E6_EUMVA|nr:hypothetical protein EVAR_88597_1 [Eumeta japonica]